MLETPAGGGEPASAAAAARIAAASDARYWVSRPRRPRHSASAWRGSGNSQGMPPITGKPLLQAAHIQPARSGATGPRPQRGQASTLDKGFWSGTGTSS